MYNFCHLCHIFAVAGVNFSHEREMHYLLHLHLLDLCFGRLLRLLRIKNVTRGTTFERSIDWRKLRLPPFALPGSLPVQN